MGIEIWTIAKVVGGLKLTLSWSRSSANLPLAGTAALEISSQTHI
jgi:hypothetical protein